MAAANPEEVRKIVRSKVWLDTTREYLHMSKRATEEDDEDVEFVDDYKQTVQIHEGGRRC